jgi:uncharacterized protein (DUF58 family)
VRPGGTALRSAKSSFGGMTLRGRLLLVLAAVTYIAAWAFGSRTLYPVAVGLSLAVALAWVWARSMRRPMRIKRRTGHTDHVEGADVLVEVELEPETALVPSAVLLVERIGRLGERSTVLERRGRRLGARYVLQGLPRGRYAFTEARAVLDDPFGLERVEQPLADEGTLLVYPRLVELEGVFSQGIEAHQGRRLALWRPVGFDLHSVREYQQGESLRKVHWPTTARRGELMVKDFDDAARDEVAVILDAQGGLESGTPPDSSFEAQVRAAGSILQAHVRAGRRSVLVVNGARRAVQEVHTHGAEWRQALELLASVEPDGPEPLASLLADDASPAARALELVVVTASVSAPLADRLAQRARARRRVALVYVDPASFAQPPKTTIEPLLLRLQAAGLPVAVVRRGDDLGEVLGTPAREGAAYG